MQIVENTEFMNVQDAAKFLGVSAYTIYSWTMRKTIPHYKLGRLLRFKKSDLVNYMESLKVETSCQNNCHCR